MFIRYLLLTLLLASPAFAQGTKTPTPEEVRAMESLESKKIFDKLADQQFRPLPTSPKAAVGIKERDRFYETVPEFRAATAEYRVAVSSTPDVARLVRNIEKLIEPLKDYFEVINVKSRPVNLSEYEGLSSKDLVWETLTVAETVDNNLQIAHKVVQQSDRDGHINIKALLFFCEIQDDLTRLRFLASKVARR